MNWITRLLCRLPNEVDTGQPTGDGNGNIYMLCSNKIFVSRNGSKPEVLCEQKVDFGCVCYGNNNLYLTATNFPFSIYQYDLSTNEISLLAGNQERETKDGPFLEASFDRPWSVKTDKNGDLYVCDDFSVRKLDMKTRMVSTVGGHGKCGYKDGESSQAEFYFLCGITVTDDNTVYVGDEFNRCIRKIKDGYVSTVAGTNEQKCIDGPFSIARFTDPVGVCWDKFSQLLLVADSSSLRVVDSKQQRVSTLPFTTRKVVNDAKGNCLIILGEEIFLIEHIWKYAKLVWIGHLKEDAKSCCLARLPKDIVKEIIRLLK